MIYTPKIQKAIKFANLVHVGQIRKGKPHEPYIIHPLTVGLILSQAGATEDQIVAGILHDTIEDCDPWGSITKDGIEKEFGSEVARMVNDVTEQDKNLSWVVRKKEALEHVKEMHEDSVMVKSADVLNNMTDQMVDFEKKGDKMFESYNATKAQQLARYQNLVPELKKAYPANPLIPELEVAVDEIGQMWR